LKVGYSNAVINVIMAYNAIYENMALLYYKRDNLIPAQNIKRTHIGLCEISELRTRTL